YPKFVLLILIFRIARYWHSSTNIRAKCPNLKLIAHSDDDSEQVVIPLLKIGFSGYLLIGSDTNHFKNAIEGICNGKKNFSVGILGIAREYFSNKKAV